MKVVSSIKSAKKRHPDCQVVRRRGKIYVINKTDPRYKARQGWFNQTIKPWNPKVIQLLIMYASLMWEQENASWLAQQWSLHVSKKSMVKITT